MSHAEKLRKIASERCAVDFSIVFGAILIETEKAAQNGSRFIQFYGRFSETLEKLMINDGLSFSRFSKKNEKGVTNSGYEISWSYDPPCNYTSD
jgi:hypothetical protein